MAKPNSNRRPLWLQAARALNRLDPLVRHLIVNWALGAMAGVISATALLIVDPFGLRPLLEHSDMAAVALSCSMSAHDDIRRPRQRRAVMFPPKDDDQPRGRLPASAVSGELEAEARVCQRAAAGLTDPGAEARPVSQSWTL